MASASAGLATSCGRWRERGTTYFTRYTCYLLLTPMPICPVGVILASFPRRCALTCRQQKATGSSRQQALQGGRSVASSNKASTQIRQQCYHSPTLPGLCNGAAVCFGVGNQGCNPASHEPYMVKAVSHGSRPREGWNPC